MEDMKEMMGNTDTAVKIFENEQFGQVRTVMKDGEPWFVAADVCKALEIDSTATRRLDEDEKAALRLTQTSSNGTAQEREVTIVNEPGLYVLVLGSRKPEAKVFKRWITHEVIPTIRKTGGYVANDDQFVATYLPFADEATKALFRATLEVVNQQNKKIAADAPKVNYYDALIDRGVNLSLRETGKELGLGQNRFIAKLVDDKYLYRTSNNKLCAYSEYTESGKGYFTLKECINRASDWGGVQTLVTPKGRDFFRKKYGVG